jgi:hypothetical protein
MVAIESLGRDMVRGDSYYDGAGLLASGFSLILACFN